MSVATLETTVCTNCARESEDLEPVDDYGDFCPDCYSDVTFLCDGCDEVQHVDAVAFSDGIFIYCDGCLREFVSECFECREPRRKTCMDFDGAGDGLCSTCIGSFVICGHCERWTSDSEFVSVLSVYMCQSCIEWLDLIWCGNCEEYEQENERCTGHNIHDYGYKPRALFHSMPGEDTQLFFGLELEVECTGDWIPKTAAETMLQSLNTDGSEDVVYAKNDGSLHCGVEFVFHPMTVEYARQLPLEDALRSLREHGVRAWDTTTAGIHVHVSRAGLGGRVGTMRFAMLITKNQVDVERVAGRSSSFYADYERQPRGKDASKVYGGPRYVPVNMQPQDTVEVRVFRSTLKHERILAILDLVNAAAVYAATTSTYQWLRGAGEWPAFVAWSVANGYAWPAFYGDRQV